MPQNFASPWAAAGNAIFQYLAQRDADQRQAMLDDIVAKREERLGESADANRDLARQQFAMNEESRQLQNAAARQTMGAKMEQSVGIGDTNAAQADVIEAGGGTIERTLPSRTQAFLSAVPQGPASPNLDAAPPVAPGVIATGPQTQRTGMYHPGNAEQQAIDRLNIPDDVKRLVQAGKIQGPALVDMLMPQTEDEVNGQRTEAINPATGKNEIVLLNPRTGEAKWTGLTPPPDAAGGSGRGYTMVVPTAQGTLLVDGRTQRVVGQFDSKPSSDAENDITAAQVINDIFTSIERDFKPERVGPVMGRFRSMQDMFTGVEDDPGLAAFRADVAMMRNTIIQLRTGAAMSEPEARRIFEEVINVNLPPSTFMERLTRAKHNYNEYLKKRSKLAFGRTTTQDVDQMTGTQRGAPGSAVTPAPGVVVPAPTGSSKYKIVERR